MSELYAAMTVRSRQIPGFDSKFINIHKKEGTDCISFIEKFT